MASRKAFNDFNVRGGYLMIKPHHNYRAEDVEEDEDNNDQAWRHKAHLLQRRRWQKIVKKANKLQ